MVSEAVDRATSARILALRLTRDVRERNGYLRELVESRRAESELPAEEFDFALVLAYGVVMCRGTLDEAIDRSLSSPRDVKPKVRDALRISAYELLFLKKPAHAVVDQGVELVRHVTSRAAGLANAVLHKMVRDAESFPWGDAETDDAAYARLFGMPEWLATKFALQLGRQHAAEMMRVNFQAAPRYLRENPFDASKPFASDLSAQRVAELVPLEGTILEIGAGRGTKTMLLECHAIETLGRAVPIHAVDLHEYRAELHRARMKEAGIADVLSLAGDARDLDAIEGVEEGYASILLDAPCSGTGTLRRHPEIRWNLRPEDVRQLVELQKELLSEAASRTLPGGTLVYATCSVLQEENQDMVDDFLAKHPEGTWELRETFQSIPESNGPDGHFACVLERVR